MKAPEDILQGSYVVSRGNSMSLACSLKSLLLKPSVSLANSFSSSGPALCCLRHLALFGLQNPPSHQKSSLSACKATEFAFKLLPNLSFGRDGSKSNLPSACVL